MLMSYREGVFSFRSRVLISTIIKYNSVTMNDMHERFNSKLLTILDTKKANSGFLTKERYDDLLIKVANSKNKIRGKKPEDYQRLKRYDVMKVGNDEKLIFPISKNNPNIRFYVYFEELFPIIHETHLSIGHGGRNRMLKELQKKYKNVTTEAVMIYLNLCENCQKKSKIPKKGLDRPMVIREINSRCQVDLIDMQSQPDNDFKFIFVYQDHLTKFIQLHALKSSHAEEVASHLIEIFTVFGAPSVLQSDNGREFCSRIVEEACRMWPDLMIVHGKQSQGTSKIVKDVLNSWLESNKTSNWSKGLCFVQLMINGTFHEDIKCTPYEAMFRKPLKVGLRTSSFPNDSLKYLRTEEELQTLLETISKTSDKNNTDVKHDCSLINNDLLCPSEGDFMIDKIKEEVMDEEEEDEEEIHFDEMPVKVKLEIEDDSNAVNDSVVSDCPNFVINKIKEEMTQFGQTDVLTSEEQVRKHKISTDECLGAKKMLKISNHKFSSANINDLVKDELQTRIVRESANI